VTNYEDGRRAEYKVRDDMTEHGWRLVCRASSSKGSADLVMVSPEYGAAFVQVKRGGSAFPPSERAALGLDAADAGALPILARVVPRQGITYTQLGAGEWTP
jgi:hypothetical protein